MKMWLYKSSFGKNEYEVYSAPNQTYDLVHIGTDLVFRTYWDQSSFDIIATSGLLTEVEWAEEVNIPTPEYEEERVWYYLDAGDTEYEVHLNLDGTVAVVGIGITEEFVAPSFSSSLLHFRAWAAACNLTLIGIEQDNQTVTKSPSLCTCDFYSVLLPLGCQCKGK